MRSVGVLVAALVLVALGAGCYGSDFVGIQGDQFVFRGQVVKLKGTNYYPRDHMWAGLWDGWDWSEMVVEAGMVRDLGMNCVRILVPYSKGGWNGANPPEDRLQKLEALVNLFGDNGVRSCITLFDWETSFPAMGTSKEQDHLKYLSAIVNRLNDNEYVFMWDVKNEPDHPSNIGDHDNWDDDQAQRDKIVSWLHRMCDAVRAIDSNHPVSAGLRWWQNLDDVVGFVDIAIFHSYWPNVTQEITDARLYMGANQKPILCEEFGWPTNPWPCNRDGQEIWDYNETQQLSLYTNHLTTFTAQNTAGCVQWMTFDSKDYTSNPDESFEQYFGLWHHDYSLKPAGAYYRDHFPVTRFPARDAPPDPVSGFAVSPVDLQLRLSWVNPSNADFAGTVIRVSTSGYPADANSGTLVCDRSAAPGSSDSFTHSYLQPGVMYFYSAFAYDQARHYSTAAHTSGSAGQTSLGAIRLLPDNTLVSFSGTVVAAVYPEDGALYVEEPERTCGMRVVASNTGLALGDTVDVSGTISYRTVSGQRAERQIISATANKIGPGKPLGPLAMACRSVGGGPVGPLVPGVAGGVGANNIGLLVKIAGKVTCRVNNYLWVDDGSNIPDIMGRTGVMVRCLFDPGVSVGAVVSCVGVAEGNVPSGWTTNRRCVHARSVEDILLWTAVL